jgi:hypothetical protein
MPSFHIPRRPTRWLLPATIPVQPRIAGEQELGGFLFSTRDTSYAVEGKDNPFCYGSQSVKIVFSFLSSPEWHPELIDPYLYFFSIPRIFHAISEKELS